MLLTIGHAHDPTGLPHAQLGPAARTARMPRVHLERSLGNETDLLVRAPTDAGMTAVMSATPDQ
ncbi:hypothetical protein [Streptomyces sp900105755]|uniref:Uncharacterized protein n=1 Tax=Streptomyces sp. 900105755 TaxID=3154389 RepID=A0ABV1T7F0_9ACTN